MIGYGDDADDNGRSPGKRGPEGIARALAIAAAVLAAMIVAGTAVALVSGAPRAKALREAARDAGTGLPNASSGSAGPAASSPRKASLELYTGLGRLRTVTADTPPSVVVVSVGFTYDATDRAFRDEIFSKRGDLEKLCLGFFSGKKAAELAAPLEGALKAELRGRINGLLVLGDAADLYFADFSVIR